MRRLDLQALSSLLKRARSGDEQEWNSAGRFERHAMNAALDIEALTNALWHQAVRSHEYSPHSCDACQDAKVFLEKITR